MKIREVFPGTANDSFVELQMYTGGQNVVDDHQVEVYDASGQVELTHTFNGNADSGQDQRTILLGDTAVPGRDFTDAGLDALGALGGVGAGGAACFLSVEGFGAVDCVAWGDFIGPLPDGSVGVPASPAGVTAATSLVRSIAQGCPTILDPPDDSDDSATDFSEQTPSPRGNSVSPTETDCPAAPNTTLSAIGRPANPTTITNGTFTFSATGNITGFDCKIESEAGFSSCVSPKAYPTDTFGDGTHTFQVRAVGPGGPDPSPASYTWRVDTVPPDTQINDPKPATPNANASSTLTFQALGTLAPGETTPAFQCRLITPSQPSPAFGGCTSPSNQATAASGSYTFEVAAVDQAGNVDPDPATHTWTVDRTPPDTQILTGPTQPISTSADAAFTYSSEANATFRCRLIQPTDPDPAFASCPVSGLDYSSLGDGAHTFEVKAADALGNEDVSAAGYSWTVDASPDPPPETMITKPPKKTGTDRTPTIKFKATPSAGATFECKLDGEIVACESPYTTPRLKFGKHKFRVAAIGPGGPDLTPAKAAFKIVRN